MKKIIVPQKLKPGDMIRVIAPSYSLSAYGNACIELACRRLRSYGLQVTFSKNCRKKDMFLSSGINERVSDLNDAFTDKKVKAVFAATGGFNSNQLLGKLDYRQISRNPKIFSGMSDITVLSNAIYTKTGLMTYSGVDFSEFGVEQMHAYTERYFRKCLMEDDSYDVADSKEWCDDCWDYDETDRMLSSKKDPVWEKNKGSFIVHEGKAKGTVVGGNLSSLNLLIGTGYMPDIRGAILFLEEDYEAQAHHFDRMLQSLIQQPGFEKIQAIALGRFQKKSAMTRPTIRKMISMHEELKDIPVVADLDFGHTTPMFTFPIGGMAEIDATGKKPVVRILSH